ncbi:MULTISPECIES: carbohydrate ABC transporter permease [unclassified Paenibacillus]|uniref:Carbohydrate ABC transporter permease n=1 Tax=Paenibacillus provencensis TaxID=441151 RepID=A0ABW3PPI3_9BACL|nr:MULTISPECIES: carbohydrate ABC transporter permease [unclassified Paenibacillus]MCM3130108.1 carbohydrate ABC transporter permease [Paenibacillus sp. MER 78]SFS61871.1 multiple sugar transport system permease protein [Paenibacillus sp. 453mf]
MARPVFVKNKTKSLPLTARRLVKTKLIGLEADKGLIFKCFLYVILIDTAYIYLNPIIFMITSMIKDSVDLMDPAVTWVPRVIYFGMLQDAWEMLQYPKALTISLSLSTSIAVFQTISCAVAGYAFARLDIPLKKFWFFCLLLTFIVPPQLTVLPKLIAASQLGFLESYVPLVLPALFGQGVKGALFVIIYRQFFAKQPKELEEAAMMDGANPLKVFFRVMLPLARPAIVVVFLFSFVWNWNDFYTPSIFLHGMEDQPLSVGVASITNEINMRAEEIGPSIYDEPMKMAASFLMILPPLILYIFAQRWFVEGVDRTGLVE